MNSRIHVLDLDTGKNELYTLVFPEHADISTGLISVLAPVGIALLGRRQRDIIEARVPGGGQAVTSRARAVQNRWETSPATSNRKAFFSSEHSNGRFGCVILFAISRKVL
jgi:hypothetical protein